MKIKKAAAFFAVIILLFYCAPSYASVFPENPQRDCLYQISTIQAIAAGDFYGSMTVEDFLRCGDIAIGIFDGANGELIVLDGVCYRVAGDGSIEIPSLNEKLPFASVTFFDKDIKRDFGTPITFEELKNELNNIVVENGVNMFYAVKIKGNFSDMKTRSELAQKEPYKTFEEVLKTDQRFFEYKDIKGTLVGFYCPPYASGVNVTGWHFHFLSDTKDKGGHVFDFTMSKGELELDKTAAFYMILPDTKYFNDLNLTGLDEALDRVERGKQ
ncbi:MAG: acetolactate decarboxylase [Synergistes sp.]|nr:acetolactate decarboxylase [Synergistes sp.]